MINHNEHIKNAQGLQRRYKDVLDFDLKDIANLGNEFYEDYQMWLTFTNNPDLYDYYLAYNLLHPIELFEKLKCTNEEYFNWFKNRMVKSKNNVSFFGDKFELFIAYTLIQKNIVFTRPEPPDFEIENFKDKLYIECTTSQFDFSTIPTKNEIFTKLKKTIISKLSKPYTNNNTILFVDITNLMFHSLNLKDELTDEQIQNTLVEITRRQGKKIVFGAIAFFRFYVSQNDIDEKTYNWNPFILLNNNPSQSIKEFFDFSLVDMPQEPKWHYPKFQ